MPDVTLAALWPEFLRPLWLWALLPLPLVLVLLRRRGEARDPWRAVIDAHLLPWLALPADPRATRRRLPLLVLAWLLAVCALAGPSWRTAPAPLQRPGGALVVLLDLSLSMYATDVAPSRIERAREEVQDLVERYAGGRVALVAFAGDAHVVTPLTDDVRTVTNLVASLEPAIMPVPGADVPAALRLARQLLDGGGEAHGEIVVVTDGIDDAEALDAWRDSRFPISILGIGTAAGGAIPLDFVDQPGRVLTEADGRPVVARLDAERLAELARRGGGGFVQARADDADTDALLAAGHGATPGGARAGAPVLRREDQGPWLVLLLLPLCAYAFRRGVVLALCGALTLAWAPVPARASDPASAARAVLAPWFARADQRAAAAAAAGRIDDPALATRPDWRATALYRRGRYADAAALFARDPSSDGQYNLGNALAQAGRIDEAIAAYERALAADPGNADAKHNRDLLKQRQPPKRPQDAQGGPPPQRGGAQSSNSAGQRSPGAGRPPPHAANASRTPRPAARAPGTASNPPPRADASARAPTASDAEQRRAEAQWLRRVPDDPGGLLRRKFETETMLRTLEGEPPARRAQPW